MSYYQQYPNTFSATQQTQDVLKRHDNEFKYLYSLLSVFSFDVVDALTFDDDLNTAINGGEF